MPGWIRRCNAVLTVAVAAIVVSACGSSSSTKTSFASTPSPSTPSTTSTSPSVPMPAASTPLSSPSVQTYAAQRYQTELAAHGVHLPSAKVTALAQCVINRLEAEGIKTYGEAHSAKATQTAATAACAKQLGLTKQLGGA